MSCKVWVLTVALAAIGGANLAADEPLPPPRTTPGEPVVIVQTPPIVYRASKYEVWQYLAPDRQGRFRPRVVYTPEGSYYMYSGQPYPWTTSQPQYFLPYASR